MKHMQAKDRLREPMGRIVRKSLQSQVLWLLRNRVRGGVTGEFPTRAVVTWVWEQVDHEA